MCTRSGSTLRSLFKHERRELFPAWCVCACVYLPVCFVCVLFVQCSPCLLWYVRAQVWICHVALLNLAVVTQSREQILCRATRESRRHAHTWQSACSQTKRCESTPWSLLTDRPSGNESARGLQWLCRLLIQGHAWLDACAHHRAQYVTSPDP